MAPAARLHLVALLLVAVTRDALAGGGGISYRPGRYYRVFSFGNSLTDTGNSAILPATAGGASTNPPYGETYFKRPTGRSSDGRLIIDFVVESLRLPQPTPYLAGTTADDFHQGVNFAVAGATALDPTFLAIKGITSPVPVSLKNQTTWFKRVSQLLASPGSVTEQRKMMASSLFYLGEIGFNEYSYVFMKNASAVDLAESLVPNIVAVIRLALVDMIAAGARTMVVTGMIPIGCEPELLALTPGGASPGRCIARFNQVSQLHNRALNRMLTQLQRANPGTSIIYADIYRPITAIVSSPATYGFGDTPLAACCGGGGGPYNFNFAFFCSAPTSKVCADPSAFVSWDGIHFTEAANRFLAKEMLRNTIASVASFDSKLEEY